MDTGRVSAQYRGQTGLAEGGTQWGREHRRGSVRTFPPDRWAILDFRPEFAPISILDSYSPSPDPVLPLVIHFEIRKDPKCCSKRGPQTSSSSIALHFTTQLRVWGRAQEPAHSARQATPSHIPVALPSVLQVVKLRPRKIPGGVRGHTACVWPTVGVGGWPWTGS